MVLLGVMTMGFGEISSEALNQNSNPTSWKKTELILPSFTQKKKGMKKGDQGKRAMFNGGAWFPAKGAPRQFSGPQSLPMVTLSHGLFEVDILPEQASVVSRVRNRDGMDWFYFEERIKDWIPWWESGVKASFPFMEHGIRERQPSAWQVIRPTNQSLRYSSWMEFSRHHSLKESVQFGRHSNMILEQDVEVRANDPRLRITYRVTNPMPYRQGLQCWNDAFWPRYHHPKGIVQGNVKISYPDDAELFGDMDWASDHLGQKFQSFNPKKHNPRSPGKYAYSFFIWDVQEGWTGVYYPSVDVARIRLVDPKKAPGTKWWWRTPGGQDDVNHNFIEMWGGTDHVFEGVERWLAPGHQWEATWTYLTLEGLGKPIKVNEDGMIGLKGNRISAATFNRVDKAELWVDGKKVAEGPCDHLHPLVVEGENSGEMILKTDQQVLVKAEHPRQATPLRQEMKKQIEDALNYELPEGWEKQGNQHTRGRFFRNARYGGATLGRARVHVRNGHLKAALKTLDAILETMPESGEAWHLRGACHAELGQVQEAIQALEQAIQAQQPEPEAAFLLAVMFLAKGEQEQSRKWLEQLVQIQPLHHEAKLLKAFLSENDTLARQLTHRYPADPRVRWISKKVAERLKKNPSQDEKILKTLLQQEPGAHLRIKEFEELTAGRFIHPQRLDPEG